VAGELRGLPTPTPCRRPSRKSSQPRGAASFCAVGVLRTLSHSPGRRRWRTREERLSRVRTSSSLLGRGRPPAWLSCKRSPRRTRARYPDEVGKRAALAKIERLAGWLDVVIVKSGEWDLCANAERAADVGASTSSAESSTRDRQPVSPLCRCWQIALFQAAYPLLSRSTPPPKYVPISCGPSGVALGPTFPTQTRCPPCPFRAARADS
jgi:hypothetical protein